MAITSSYPIVEPALSDTLVGTKFVENMSPTTNSFNIGELASLIAGTINISPITIGTANGLSLSGTVLSLGLSSASGAGALSAADWSTFNAKPNASDVVTLAGTQTISGAKTFSLDTIVNGITFGKGAGNNATNTVVGYEAGSSNTTGDVNSFFGHHSGKDNTTGRVNTALGYHSLQNNIDGDENVAVGAGAMLNNTGGNQNTAIGVFSLSSNISGSGNVSIGENSMGLIEAGSDNVVIGRNAGWILPTPSPTYNYRADQSVYIGTNTKALDTNQTNQIIIGYNAVGLGSNTVSIGNTNIVTTRLRGEVQGGSFKKDGGISSEYLMADGSATKPIFAQASYITPYPPVPVVFNEVNVWQPTGIVLTLSSPSPGFSLGTTDKCAFKNISGGAKVVTINASVTCNFVNDFYYSNFALALNGTVVDDSGGAAYGLNYINITWTIELQNNDEIALYVRSQQESTSSIINRCVMHVCQA